MALAYVFKLGLNLEKTSVMIQKIDCIALETYGIVTARFSFQDN